MVLLEDLMDDIASHKANLLSLNSPALTPSSGNLKRSSIVYFMRQELSQILNVYGRVVAAGQWRDYAIDHLKDEAVFSIYRRASEMPQYRIIKEPALANRQGMWRIMGPGGQTLKRGKKLDQLLKYFDRHHLKAVE